MTKRQGCPEATRIIAVLSSRFKVPSDELISIALTVLVRHVAKRGPTVRPWHAGDDRDLADMELMDP